MRKGHGETYKYDAEGERTQKTVGSDETNYYYSGTELFYTKGGSGNIIEQNVLENDGSMIRSAAQTATATGYLRIVAIRAAGQVYIRNRR